MNRGYRVAAPGSTVEMKAGAYEAQVIQPDASKPSATPVLIRPAPGASVTVFGGLTVGGSNLEIRTVAVAGAVSVENGSQLAVGATNVTLRDIRANLVYVVGRVQGIRVIGGSYGPAVNDHPQVKSYNTSDAFGPRDVLIDGVIFHDFTRSGVGVHTECLQVYDVINITIRNSKFTNCDGTASLAIGKVGTPRLDGVTVENNWFDKRGDAHYAIGLSYDIRNFTFRYNTSSESIAFLNQPSNCSMGTCGPYRFVGNYMPVQYNWCSDVATYAWNVWKGSQCAATDLNVSTMKFVDETGFDLTLAPGSEARDHGDPTDFPTSDIAGVSRPLGGAPDAGARESG